MNPAVCESCCGTVCDTVQAFAGSKEAVKCFSQDSKSLDQNQKQAPSEHNIHKSQSEPPCAQKIKYAYSHLLKNV